MDERGMLPIHYAVLKNNKKMVRLLVSHKADEIAYGAYMKGRKIDDEKRDRKGRIAELKVKKLKKTKFA